MSGRAGEQYLVEGGVVLTAEVSPSGVLISAICL